MVVEGMQTFQGFLGSALLLPVWPWCLQPRWPVVTAGCQERAKEFG